ncbi:MAG: peptidoglycan DD-metalloendopeptidase family protein [Rhodobacterales bacterium]|nr:peptidoglycan DD-metalloendopeptidase family protein [Rhodobacterales bacterium]
MFLWLIAVSALAQELDPSAQTDLGEPFFSKPFDGAYGTSGFFDHDPEGTGEKHQRTAWGSVTFGKSGHVGWDWVLPVGTDVFAVADGVVEFGGDRGDVGCGKNRRVPSSVEVYVRHVGPDGQIYRVGYLHLDRARVTEGDVVRAGEVLAQSGNTGCSSGPHLHFVVELLANQLALSGEKVDPFGWSGDFADPWAVSTGFRSSWLWLAGEAPPVIRHQRHQASGEGPQVIGVTNVAWQDDRRPNAESVTLALSLESAVNRWPLDGVMIRNNGGDTYSFPEGMTLRRGRPIRLYSGVGRDAGQVVFWGNDHGMWDDTADCVWVLDADENVLSSRRWGRGRDKPCPLEVQDW